MTNNDIEYLKWSGDSKTLVMVSGTEIKYHGPSLGLKPMKIPYSSFPWGYVTFLWFDLNDVGDYAYGYEIHNFGRRLVLNYKDPSKEALETKVNTELAPSYFRFSNDGKYFIFRNNSWNGFAIHELNNPDKRVYFDEDLVNTGLSNDNLYIIYNVKEYEKYELWIYSSFLNKNKFYLKVFSNSKENIPFEWR